MLKYYCRKCQLIFEDSISQSRCPTFKCQSPLITDITPTPSMGTEVLNNGLEDDGERFNQERDLLGRETRNNLEKYMEELLDE